MNQCHAPKTQGVSGKVTIPKFVAERIEANIDNLRGLHLTYQLSLLINNTKIHDWLADPVNAIDLIKAINYGYEVEVEYLTWDQAYQGMKEGNVYLRYSKSDMKLDYYKLKHDKLLFADKPKDSSWRYSEATFKSLLESNFVLVESWIKE